MKIVFFGLPVEGHMNPALHLMQGLARAGHRVACYASSGFGARVESAGADFRPYPEWHMESLGRRIPDLPRVLMSCLEQVLQRELESLRQEAVDLIIHDSVACWGRSVAASLGVPAASSITTFAFNRQMLWSSRKIYRPPLSATHFRRKLGSIAAALEIRRRVRRRFGVRGPRLSELYFCVGDCNLVYTSREFQPFAHLFDGRFHFVGPQIRDEPPECEFPWDRLTDPLVYVSMGTLFNEDLDLWRMCVEALRDFSGTVVLSLGGNLAPESLGTLPDHFLVRPWVPQLALLERAAALISRGGMNSVSESLYHGVPVLVIPTIMEQAIVGRRAEEVGAGRMLQRRGLSPAALRAALEEILTGPFRRGAGRMGESFRRAGGLPRALEALAAFQGSSSRQVESAPVSD